jgi:hypothetical protein
MTGERRPSRPIDAYKEIIDQLVTETSRGVNERLVVREEGFAETSDSRIFNPLLNALSAEQRQMLAQMLHAERISAIHDVLAVLSWWVDARKAGLTFRGEPMPVGIEGGLHLDYIGRLNGWEWPKGDTPAGS